MIDDKMINALLPLLPSSLSIDPIFHTQTDNIRYLNFFISGLTHKIHYSIIEQNTTLFSSILCNDILLYHNYKNIFDAIPYKKEQKEGGILVSVRVNNEIEISKFVQSTILYLNYIKDNEEEKQRQIIANAYNNIKLLMRTQHFIFEANCSNLKKDSNFIFDTIYKYNMWGAGSGVGSNAVILKGYIDFLNKFIRDKKINSIADIGCGDWQYMQHVDLTGVDYTGYDVSKIVIDIDLVKFPKHNFVHYDGNFSAIKKADLAICKDVLQHLPNEKIFEFINILRKFKYVLVANDFSERNVNYDIEMGYARCIDLRKEPFFVDCKEVYRVERMPENPDIVVWLIE